MTDIVIFDMDGTLLNTLEDLADSVNYAIGTFGFGPRDLDDVRRFLGNGAEVLVKNCIDGRLEKDDEEKCINIFKEYYRSHMDIKTKPYDGVMDTVRILLDRGFNIAIVSNKFDAAVKGLNADYFEGLFPVAIGESENVSKKPSPDCVNKALKELNSDFSRAIYVGDSEVDIMTARNSGLPCVSVTWGFRNEEFLKEIGTDYIIHDPKQLLDVIDGRNKVC